VVDGENILIRDDTDSIANPMSDLLRMREEPMGWAMESVSSRINMFSHRPHRDPPAALLVAIHGFSHSESFQYL